MRLLRDRDGDGRFDESHIFADGLLWPAGIAPWKDGVFVTAPPDIWYLKDTDHDGKADVREKVFSGFGIQNQQAMVNNLTWGLDHMIYGAAAGNGGTIRPASAPRLRVSRSSTTTFGSARSPGPSSRSADQTSSAIPSTTGATDSSAMSLILFRTRCCRCASWHETRCWPCRRSCKTSPAGRCRFSGSARSSAATDPLEPPDRAWHSICRIGRRRHHVVDAGAGVTIYRGGAYPAEFYGNAFIGDAQNNLVHRRILVPDGPTFKAIRGPREQANEFVRSSDNWFRPVNFVNAPDGTLYVLDMSREVIEAIHIPLDVVKHLNLKRGRDQGRIYRIAPAGFRFSPAPRLSQASTAQLVDALRRKGGWYRDTAHRLIHERQDPAAIEQLRKLLNPREAPLAQSRVNALWSLEGLKALENADIQLGLNDLVPQVRAQAVRLAASRLRGSPSLLEKVLALADDPDPGVRFQTALALGESDQPKVAPALLRIAPATPRTGGCSPRCCALRRRRPKEC